MSRMDVAEAVQAWKTSNTLEQVLGVELRNQSGEMHGPCPLCGEGRDRLWINREGTRATCRKCEFTGDALAWAVELSGAASVSDFLRREGLMHNRNGNGKAHKLSQRQRGSVRTEDGKGKHAMAPDLAAAIEAVTLERANEVRAWAVRDAARNLVPDTEAAVYLAKRMIPLGAARAAGVGMLVDDGDNDDERNKIRPAEFVAAGLFAWSGNTGRLYPRWFRGHRLFVPALDSNGMCTGIILRAVGPVNDGDAKELSPPSGHGDVRILGLDALGVNRHADLASESPVVLIAEGTPDYLTGRCALNLPTLGIPGTSRWQAVREHRVRDLIPESATIVVALDADESARKASARLWDALRNAPQRVVVVEPAQEGADLTDLLQARGADDLRAAVLKLATGDADESGGLVRIPDEALTERLAALDAKRNGHTTPMHPETTSSTDSARVVYVDGHIGEMVDRSLAALATCESVFQRRGQLVHVITYDSGDGNERFGEPARIKLTSTAHLRELLSRRLDFQRERKDDSESVAPPREVADAIATRGYLPGIRELTGIVDVPTLRPNGTIIDSPGYDAATGLLYEPRCEVPDIPVAPTMAHAQAAVEHLLDAVCDFPFASAAHRSAWLASLLTVVARHTFLGCAPMFLIDANTRGSGKSLLADVVGIIATGRPMARFSAPGDDDEMRKRITSIAIAGDALVLIDNVNTALGGASLDAALTGTVWRDRILGKSELVELPLHVTWFATGNNVQLRADTSRRACHVRLESPHERPEDRADFRHRDLLAHVAANRGEYVASALTLLSAFCRAGRPDPGLRPWGSFTEWSQMIRGAVVWSGQPDPGETRLELQEAADVDAQALAQLIRGWGEVNPEGDGLTSAKLAKLVNESPASCPAVAGALADLCGRKIDARAIGYRLRRFRGRVVGGAAIVSRKGHGGTAVWAVEAAGSGNPVSQFGGRQTTGGGDGGDGCDVSPTPSRVTPARAHAPMCEPGENDHHHRNHHHHTPDGSEQPAAPAREVDAI